MLSEIKSAQEHGTIYIKKQNNLASDLRASEQLANQNAWQADTVQSIFISCD